MVLLLIFFCAVPFSLRAIDIEITAGAGNFSFDHNETEYLSDENNPLVFKPGLSPILNAAVSGVTGMVYYRGGFERDFVMRNRLFANAGVDLAYFNIDAGVFLGLFNSKQEMFNPGLSISMAAQLPGIILLKLNALSSIGGGLSTIGSYTQKTGGISIGFWVPYIVCSLNLQTQNFTIKEEANLLIEDSLVKYFFRADVFTKNVPYTISIDFGYGILKRTHYSQSVIASPLELVSNALIDELKFIYLGLKVDYTVNSSLKIFAKGEIPFYSWASPHMKVNQHSTLFQMFTGVVLTF